MKRNETLNKDDKCWVCLGDYGDVFRDAEYERKGDCPGYHYVSTHDSVRLHHIHRLQIRKTPPKKIKKLVTFEDGEECYIKVKLTNNSPEANYPLWANLILKDDSQVHGFCTFSVDGKENTNHTAPALRKIKRKA